VQQIGQYLDIDIGIDFFVYNARKKFVQASDLP